MKKPIKTLFMIAMLTVTTVVAHPAAALPAPSTCEADKPHPSGNGATYRICLPATWNGDLVIYAHGYVPPTVPTGVIPEDQLQLFNGTTLPGVINGLGYAFATTSYHKNGLAVLEGIEDVREVASVFKQRFPNTKRVYLTGVSEGGLVTTLALERFPTEFSGGLSTCGPIGDFQAQTNYINDMRVAFDYFFPRVLPPSPVNIAPATLTAWPQLQTSIGLALATNPTATKQLLAVTKAPIDLANPVTSTATTVIGTLFFNILGTNDTAQQLGGQAFDNHNRRYRGSRNDAQLNAQIQRFTGDAAAMDAIQKYQTSGKLNVPMVTMHTTGDPIVPYAQQVQYFFKSLFGGSFDKHTPITIPRYGHCNFTQQEVLFGFGLMVYRVTGQFPNILPTLPTQSARSEFARLINEHVK